MLKCISFFLFCSTFILSGEMFSQDPIAIQERACMHGNDTACIDLGDVYLNEKNFRMAYEYYNIACEYKSGLACFGIGYIYEKGLDFPVNYSQALTYYELSCKYNNANGCNLSGSMHATGKGAPINYKKALFLFDKSCSLGSSIGCRSHRHTLKLLGM